MNIGFIEDTHLRGGTQIWLTEANRYFLSKGESTIVLAPEGSWVAEECKQAGAIVESYDYEAVVSQAPAFQEIWTRALARCDVAVCTVHPPRSGFHCSVFAGKCIRDAGLRTVLAPKTGTIVPEYKREFYLPDPDIRLAVIAITDFTRKYLIEHYHLPASRVELIYQGTDVDVFTPGPALRELALVRYPLPAQASPILGSFGAFEERKGQTVLLDAVAQLRNSTLPNVHVLFVGEGPDEEMLRRKARDLSIDGQVHFHPFTREPHVAFSRIDVLVLSSVRKEGLPNVLLEAMSMGIPVVSTNLAGVPEIVEEGQTGYMCEPGDAAGLAAAISRLWAGRTQYEKMARQARTLMEEKFDKRRQFEAFRNYFYRITNN